MARKFVLSLLLVFVTIVNTFNISPKPNYVFKEPQQTTYMQKVRSSLFGFSLNLRKNSVIVGAPQAQSSIIAQRKVNETGAVYKCDFLSQQCHPYIMDTKGNTHVENSPFAYNSEKKDFQWLGGSIDGHSSDDDKLVVCAPRITAELIDHYLLHGICYWVANTREATPSTVEKIMPLRVKNLQTYRYSDNLYYNYMFGEQGISVHVTDNNEEIIIGAPGVFNWRGTVVRYRAKIQDEIGELSRRDQFGQPSGFKRQILEYVSEIPNPIFSPFKDDSYFGYAVSSGYFENSLKLLYIASAPQANMQTGEVHIFDIVNSIIPGETKIDTKYKFEGRQMGEYFGYTLLVEDFNNDGLPDIAIAAPYYSKNGEYENGAVYIYMNEGRLQFSLQATLQSTYEFNGRFGTAVSKIGDVNMDGYNDIAIAAPFENDGAVYIFFGFNEGVSTKFSQKLEPPKAAGANYSPQNFGHGLSRGADIDGNSYNDIAIGSSNSEVVYVYKTYPVVKVITSIIPTKKEIGLNETSFQFNACWRYESRTGLERSVNFYVTLKLDSSLGRAVFEDRTNQRIVPTTINDIESCFLFDVFVKSSIADIFKPIYIDMSHSIFNEFPKNNDFCDKCILTDPNFPSSIREKVSFITGCKAEKCVSDLKLTSKFIDFKSPYVIGSTRTISLQYDLTNVGETAYLAQVNVTIPSVVKYSKIPSNCQLIDDTRSDLLCDIGRGSPFFNRKKATLIIILDTTKADGKAISIEANALSSGEELHPDDNSMIDTIELTEFSDLEIFGKSLTPQISLDKNEGITNITNQFEIRNNGPSNLRGMTVSINFPISYRGIQLVNFNDVQIMGLYNNQNLKFTWMKNNEIILLTNTYEVTTEDNDPQLEEVDNILNAGFNKNFHKQAMDYEMLGQNENTDSDMPLTLGRKKRSFNYFSNDIMEHEIVKRSVKKEEALANRTVFFNCNNGLAHCVQAVIEIDNFKASDTQIFVSIEFGIDLKQVEKVFQEKEDILQMQILTDIEKMDDEGKKTFSIAETAPITIVYKQLPKSTPWWVFAVSIGGGLLVLLLLSFGLLKLGFFKRKQKEELEKLTKENCAMGESDEEDN